MERSRTTGDRLFVYFATQRCPSKSLSFARISYANAQGRQNHGRTESCREKDQGQSSMILSGHDSVVSGCGASRAECFVLSPVESAQQFSFCRVGRARHSVRAGPGVPVSERRARSDAPYPATHPHNENCWNLLPKQTPIGQSPRSPMSEVRSPKSEV
jgi:hypothetical protein